jgi:hypothetical protein
MDGRRCPAGRGAGDLAEAGQSHGGALTHIEQHKMILELMDYLRRMKRNDQEEFEMFAKRDKDDEDLDSHSMRRLQQLYEQYVPARLRNW